MWWPSCDSCAEITNTEEARTVPWVELKYDAHYWNEKANGRTSFHFCDEDCLASWLEKKAIEVKETAGLHAPIDEPVAP